MKKQYVLFSESTREIRLYEGELTITQDQRPHYLGLTLAEKPVKVLAKVMPNVSSDEIQVLGETLAENLGLTFNREAVLGNLPEANAYFLKMAEAE